MSSAPMTKACSRCGVFLTSEAQTLYSDDGDPMCLKCRETIDQQRRDVNEARQLFLSSIGALFASIFGLPLSMLFVLGAMPLSFPAAGVGLRVSLTLRGASKGTIESLGGRVAFVRFASGAATIIGGIGVAIMLVQIALALFQIATRPH